jgi:hypothetical protein
MPEREGERSKRSRWLFLGGIASIVLGFVLLGMNDPYLAPFLLVFGYLVLVPYKQEATGSSPVSPTISE